MGPTEMTTVAAGQWVELDGMPYIVAEANGDRCLVRPAQSKLPIPPVELVRVADLAPWHCPGCHYRECQCGR